jgi:hypothetical protein
MYFNKKFGDLSAPENFERCIHLMSQYKRLRAIKLDVEQIRREFPNGAKTYVRLFSLIGAQFAGKQGKQRWGDKSLNTERYMDDIFAVYPNAKIIHMMRDPRDRYASAKTRWVGMKGRAGAGTIMWLESVQLARRGIKKYPNNYKVVRYEDVVTNPEQTLRDVCDFLGEEYTPDMLGMTGAPGHRDKGGNSSYGKRDVGVISSDSVGRYRQILPAEDIKFMQDFCRSGMTQFGYGLDNLPLSGKRLLAYFCVDFPLGVFRMLLWGAKQVFIDIRGRKLPARRLVLDASD